MQSFFQAEGLLRSVAEGVEDYEVAVPQPDLCRMLAFQGGLVQQLRSTAKPVRDRLRLHEVETLNRQRRAPLHRVGNRGK